MIKRSNDRILRCRAVWCDYDRKKQQSPKDLSELLASFPLEPSIVVETSPGNYHFYWLAEELGRGPFGAIMDRLVADYGHDPAAKDAARVMRLPGFLHQKGNPHLVEIIGGNKTRYHREALRKAFPPVEKLVRPKIEPEDDEVLEEWEIERQYVRDALSYLPSDGRTVWFVVGGAIFDASQGSSDGFEIWDEWSKSCAKKYDAIKQVRYWDREFKSARSERATLGSIYFLALKNGWPGTSASLPIENSEMPAAKVPAGGDLTRATIASLRKTFEQRGHRPAESHWMALEALAATLEAMSSGSLDPLYYVCSLAPGMGKTQTLIHFVRQLVKSPNHADAAVVIFVGRIAEIKNLVADMGLNDSDYAVLVTKKEENKELNSSGNPVKTDARVFFTTHQMLVSRGRGKAFADISEFHYRGGARSVRIWDEAILPAKPLRVNLTQIEGMTNVIRKSRPELQRVIEKLIESIKNTKDRGFVEIPDFKAVCHIDLKDARAIFKGEKPDIKDAAKDLWLLAGKTVVARHEQGGNSVINYKDGLPDDLKPMVVTDASGAVRQTYPHWSQGRGDLAFLPHADKDYSKLAVHIWKRGGGRSTFRKNDVGLIDGIVATINSGPPGEDWLIVHHKFDQGKFPTDVPARVRSRVKCRVHAVHWGDHSASNEFRDVKNVILAGTLFNETSHLEALGRMSGGLESDDVLDQRRFNEIKSGEHAHVILQALCRGSVRKSDGVGCYPCDAYIIAAPGSGIPRMLQDGGIFPGCKVVEWRPVRKELTGRVARAIEFLKSKFAENANANVTATVVCREIGMGNDRTTFHQEVIKHPDFIPALDDEGIVLERGRGRNGSRFKMRKAYKFGDLPF